MTVILTTRRRFLLGLGVLAAAPAIVRVGSIMPVKSLPDDPVVIIKEVFGRPPLTDEQIWEWFRSFAGAAAQHRMRRGESGPMRARWGDRLATFGR